MKKIIVFTLVSIFVLTIGLVRYVRARSQPRQGVTIMSTVTRNSVLSAVQVRYVKASGDWYLVSDYYKPDGSFNKRTLFAGTTLGAVRINGNQTERHGNAVLSKQLPADAVRDGSVLGYPVYVSGGEVREWRAPALGNEMLRMQMPGGQWEPLVFQAVAVVVGEPQFTVPN